MPVYVLNAPPCAGKTTYVREHAHPDDVVIDYDMLAQALGSSRTHGHAPHFDAIVGKARWAAIKAALETSRTHNTRVWIIDSCIPEYRQRAYEAANAQFIRLDVDIAELHRRADQERPPLWHQLIDDWAPLLRDAGPSWRPEREHPGPKPWPKRPAHRRGVHTKRYEQMRAAFLRGYTNCENCRAPFITDAPCEHRKCLRRGKGCIYHPQYPTVQHDKHLATGGPALDPSTWRAWCLRCNQSDGGRLAQRLARQPATGGTVDLSW